MLQAHLRGKELEAVTFVRDYVQFAFGDTTLTIYSPPSVTTPTGVISPDNYGYADVLRGLIGETVEQAGERLDDRLEVVFESGSRLIVAPDSSLPEVAMLHRGDGSTWAVW